MDENLQRSVDLLNENEDGPRDAAENALFTICNNILSRPEDKGYREVRLDDSNVIEKLLPACGAMECLFDVGFTEASNYLLLPLEAPLFKLEALQRILGKRLADYSRKQNVQELHHLIPPSTMPKEKSFFLDIAGKFVDVMRYENPILLEKARKLIPIVDLEIAAVSKIRKLQMHMKSNQANLKNNDNETNIDPGADTKDFFLAEVLAWFKEKFFTWVNSPDCPKCLGKSTFYKVISSDDPRCSRIELHRCTDCKTLIKFPRYTDLDLLLTTRCGRCGEWANVFTLFCRSLGYDARIVYDISDHLWTEVWSILKNRWIHVDPCENAMDRPLMYEKGWGKKLSYIIAFSKDEVNDVTWRYTQDQKAVMARRKHCSEKNLLQFMNSLNKHRQSSASYSAARRRYIIKRRLMELAELIHLPNQRDLGDSDTYQGRTTGSYAWRLARGEISQEDSPTNYVWDISKYGRTFQLHYFIVKDLYKVVGDDDETLIQKSGWKEGVNATEGGIFRKSEQDWKMAYLARSPGNERGKVTWCFQVANPNLRVWKFELRAVEKVFHDATMSWEIQGLFDNKQSRTLPITDCSNYRTDELRGARELILTVKLADGQGDNAWQHAQLFRASFADEDLKSMVIIIRLQDQ